MRTEARVAIAFVLLAALPYVLMPWLRPELATVVVMGHRAGLALGGLLLATLAPFLFLGEAGTWGQPSVTRKTIALHVGGCLIAVWFGLGVAVYVAAREGWI